MRVILEKYDSLMQVVERARRFFDLGANPTHIRGHLGKTSTFAPLVKKRPGLRLPGTWDPFEVAIGAAFGESATSKASVEIIECLVRALGTPSKLTMPGVSHLFPTPSTVLSADLKAIGVPEPQTALFKAIAELFSKEESASHSNVEVLITKLTMLPALSGDSVSYIAMRGFGEPDVFPQNDPLLARALNMGMVARSLDETTRLIDQLRPWRSYAAMHLEAELYDQQFTKCGQVTRDASVREMRSTSCCPGTWSPAS